VLPSEACPTLCGLLGGKRIQHGVSNTHIFGIFIAKVARKVGGGPVGEGGGDGEEKEEEEQEEDDEREWIGNGEKIYSRIS